MALLPVATDRGTRMDFNAKSIRLRNGARVEAFCPTLLDHFVMGAGAFNTANPQQWVTTEPAAATQFAPSATDNAAIGVTGATTNNSEEFAGKNVCWKPSTMAANMRMALEVRAKFVGATTPLDGDFYLGFANAVTFAASLPYVLSAASALTTSAPVEFAGFGASSICTSGPLFSTAPTIGIITEKASVAATPISTGILKDTSFHRYRVELNAAGDATFFIDDNQVGSQPAAVTPTVALTPYIVAVCKNSHAVTATLKYVFVGGDSV